MLRALAADVKARQRLVTLVALTPSEVAASLRAVRFAARQPTLSTADGAPVSLHRSSRTVRRFVPLTGVHRSICSPAPR